MTDKQDTVDLIHTGMCLWEAAIDFGLFDETKDTRIARRLRDLKREEGTFSLRTQLAAMASDCDADWDALSEDEKMDAGAFDWEFVPDWLERKLVGPYPTRYGCHGDPLPWDVFEQRYGVILADDETPLRPFDDPEVRAAPVYNVWTVVDDGDGELFVVPGFATVNYQGRILTERTWADAEQGSAGYCYL